MSVFGFAWVADTATEDRGSLSYIPISGGSDQIDFTIMAYTFYEYSVPGTGFGERGTGPVVDWAASNNKTGALLDRWNERRSGEEGVRIYTCRPHLYPLLLGSVFKVTGYNPAVAPVVDAVLFGLTDSLILGFGAYLASWFAGYTASAMFLSVSITQVWARQTMPETLVLFLVALFVVGLYVVLSRGELTPVWPPATLGYLGAATGSSLVLSS